MSQTLARVARVWSVSRASVYRVECLGIEASPSFVREPQGNGVAECFIRTSHGDVRSY